MSTSLEKLHEGNLTPAISYLKISVMIGVAALVIILSVLGYMYYRDNQKSQVQELEIEIASSHIPEGYYPPSSKSGLRDKKEQLDEKEAQAQKVVVVQPVKEYGNAQVATASDNQTITVQPQVTQLETPTKLTKEEAFLKVQLDLLAQVEAQRKNRLAARRQKQTSGWEKVETIETLQAKKKKQSPPSDDDFGIDKDVSTFPVDLSRVVTADRYIPCILVDQINSQIEGRATCTVERNVYGYHGRNILIPAGSKFMGSHGTLKKVGDERFNIEWKRMLRPDGAHVSLTDAYASDRIGSTGIEGIVDRRNWEKYGGALLTSTISVLAQMSIPSEGTTITNSAAESFATDMGRVTAAMLNENINIKPYSIVPAGERILITPVTDIWLKKDKEQMSFKAVNQEEAL